MTFRAGMVLGCLGLVALAVVWLRTEKRRSRGTAARLEIRKFELETERWRLGREVAQRTNPSELRARAAAFGFEPEPEPSVDPKADAKKGEARRGNPSPAPARRPGDPVVRGVPSRPPETAVRAPAKAPSRPATADLD